MTVPYKLACPVCGFATTDPTTFVDHCLTTQHVELVPPGAEDVPIAELLEALSTIQTAMANPDAELPQNTSIRPITIDDILDDDSLTEEEKTEIIRRIAALKEEE